MTRAIPASTRRVGIWSAMSATVCSLAYVVAQLAEWAGLLGSAGGPESVSTPAGIILLLTPSILLGSSFLLVAASLHDAAPAGRRVWSQSALAFATVYAVLISLVYFVQLTFVGPRLAAGRMEGIEVFQFVPFDSFLYAVDILGYSFMSAATLMASPVFTGPGERNLRFALLANGLLLPFIALQMYVHALIWIAALWAITFPVSMWLLGRWFHRAATLERSA